MSHGVKPLPLHRRKRRPLSDSLKRADTGETQLHILYVHGMGIDTPKHKDGTQDFEVSQEFKNQLLQANLLHYKDGRA